MESDPQIVSSRYCKDVETAWPPTSIKPLRTIEKRTMRDDGDIPEQNLRSAGMRTTEIDCSMSTNLVEECTPGSSRSSKRRKRGDTRQQSQRSGMYTAHSHEDYSKIAHKRIQSQEYIPPAENTSTQCHGNELGEPNEQEIREVEAITAHLIKPLQASLSSKSLGQSEATGSCVMNNDVKPTTRIRTAGLMGVSPFADMNTGSRSVSSTWEPSSLPTFTLIERGNDALPMRKASPSSDDSCSARIDKLHAERAPIATANVGQATFDNSSTQRNNMLPSEETVVVSSDEESGEETLIPRPSISSTGIPQERKCVPVSSEPDDTFAKRQEVRAGLRIFLIDKSLQERPTYRIRGDLTTMTLQEFKEKLSRSPIHNKKDFQEIQLVVYGPEANLMDQGKPRYAEVIPSDDEKEFVEFKTNLERYGEAFITVELL